MHRASITEHREVILHAVGRVEAAVSTGASPEAYRAAVDSVNTAVDAFLRDAWEIRKRATFDARFPTK